MKKVIGMCLMGCLVVVLLSSFAFSGANADFGETLTTAQMANMFGGAWNWTCDRDCPVAGGSDCTGGNTSCSTTGANCYDCLTTDGEVCSSPPGGAGWVCTNGTASCDGDEGVCISTTNCSVGGTPPSGDPATNCATRAQCDEQSDKSSKLG